MDVIRDLAPTVKPTIESVHSAPTAVSGARARRKANGYLCLDVGLFFGAADPVYVDTEPPLWQVTIELVMPRTRPITLGTLDINAQTGNVIPLSPPQIESLQERVRAIVERTPSAAAA